MKTITFKNNWLTATALMLVLPTAFFILIGILSEFGITWPMETIQPVAEYWGIKDPPGLNITSVILFGPMVALLLTIFQFLKIEWHFSSEEFLLNLSFQKRWFPILVAVASMGALVMLSFYMFVENCSC